MNESMKSLSAATLAFTLLAPAAWAGQDAPAAQQNAPASEAGTMGHGQMNHEQMDHSQMPKMDHDKMPHMGNGQMQDMDHGAMHKDAKPKAESNDDR